MAKAMLIMDMPKYCNDCIMVIDSFGYCQAKQKDIPNYKFESDCNEKPSWCPLREVPQKKIEEHTILKPYEDTPWHKRFVTEKDVETIGYNACIDEILGGGE